MRPIPSAIRALMFVRYRFGLRQRRKHALCLLSGFKGDPAAAIAMAGLIDLLPERARAPALPAQS